LYIIGEEAEFVNGKLEALAATYATQGIPSYAEGVFSSVRLSAGQTKKEKIKYLPSRPFVRPGCK
jgi:hypothetical protein